MDAEQTRQAEQLFKSYLDTGDLAYLRTLNERHCGRLVEKLQALHGIDEASAQIIAAKMWLVVEAMHGKSREAIQQMRRNLGLDPIDNSDSNSDEQSRAA